MPGLTFKLKRSANVALSLLAVVSISNITGMMTPASASRGVRQISLADSKRNTQDKKGTFNGDGSGSLVAMLGSGKQLGQCPLKHTDVKASVSGYVSRVSVKQTFQNNFKEKIEAVYTFPLPENAAVDEMTMRIGQRVIKGNIKKREEAKEIYETAKAQGHVASLLDQERPNIFTQSVANIEPGASIEIEIKYVETLAYEAGSYTFDFPTVVGPRFIPGSTAIGRSGRGRVPDTDVVPDASKITPKVAPAGERAGHDISISVDIDAGVPIHAVSSKLHEVNVKQTGTTAHIDLVDKNTIPNKDFVLKWDVAGEKIQSGYLTHCDDKSGYFTLMLLPPKKVQLDEVSPKEMIFLIDCSGSQSGAPLEKAKETMHYILEHMNAHDTFQIVAFNNGQTQLADRPLPANSEAKRKAKDFIAHLQANGGTWMAPAVEKVCAMPEDDHRLRIVTFMTDGYVGNDMEIMGMIKKYRAKSRWFSFGTGNSVNRFLIDGIAKEGGGEADYVLLNSPGNEVGKKFYDRISSPVLTDLKLDFQGLDVKEVFPHELSDVWAEKPLYIKGRYNKPGAGTITLTGYAGGKPYKQELKVKFPEKQSANEVIKPMWARAKVDRLMSEDWMGAQRGQINQELKDEITKTALDYHIMTQYTSFVAVEEKRVTKGGTSTTVDVPVELPSGVDRSSTLGDEAGKFSPVQGFVGRAVSGGGGGGAGMSFAQSAPSLPRPMVHDYRRSMSARKSVPTSLEFESAPSAPPPVPMVAAQPQAPSFSRNEASLFSNGVAKREDKERQKAGAEKDTESELKKTNLRSAAESKLDRTLLKLLNARKNGLPAKVVEGVEIRDGKVLVKITLSDLSEATLKKLKSHGLEILVTNQKEKSLIARITTQELEELSDEPEVRKIEASHN